MGGGVLLSPSECAVCVSVMWASGMGSGEGTRMVDLAQL